jgi:hypothetical protein
MKTLVDCGCAARVYTDGSGIEIDYCPAHQAAPDLLQSTKAAWHLCESLLASRIRIGTAIGFVGPTAELIEEIRDACAAAIAKAEMRDEEQHAITFDDWLCSCGNYIEDGLHCPRCRREPPWGCPCAFCQDPGAEEEDDG